MRGGGEILRESIESMDMYFTTEGKQKGETDCDQLQPFDSIFLFKRNSHL